MKLSFLYALFLIFSQVSPLPGEEFSVNVIGTIDVSNENPAGGEIQLSYDEAVLTVLGKDLRFLSGIEIELNAHQNWLANQGVLALVLYSKLKKFSSKGKAVVSATQISSEIIPNKIQTVYQIPLKKDSELKVSPYIILFSNIVPPEDFPLLVRIMPAANGISEEVQDMRFVLKIKPVFSDKGAVKINVRYPHSLPGKPWTVLIDDNVIEKPEEEHFYKEGEHHLMLISSDYRNESRRFIIEHGKTLELNITLQDLTPLLIFETPDIAKVFIDNVRLPNASVPKTIEHGPHEIKIQVSDYTIIKTIYVNKGKTYRIAFTVGLDVYEEN